MPVCLAFSTSILSAPRSLLTFVTRPARVVPAHRAAQRLAPLLAGPVAAAIFACRPAGCALGAHAHVACLTGGTVLVRRDDQQGGKQVEAESRRKKKSRQAAWHRGANFLAAERRARAANSRQQEQEAW